MQSDSVRLYHQLFEAAVNPLLYNAPWWLEATCGTDGWDAVIQYDDNGIPAAALPYHLARIRGLSAVITPPLTQWVSMFSSASIHHLTYQSFLHALPQSPILDITFKPGTETLFQDGAFPVHLKYSFIIPYNPDIKGVRERYNEGLKRNLRQAEKNYLIRESHDISTFLSLCVASYQQRKMTPPHWLDRVIPNVFNQLITHERGALTFAILDGKVIAGILTGWDQDSSYYLAGGRIADEQGASAHALLLDHAIQLALEHGRQFDFEGSMHPGIANFFQSYGAVPISYWHVRRFRGFGRLWSLFH